MAAWRAFLLPDVGNKQRQRHWCDPVNAPRLPDRARSDQSELLSGLVGQAFDLRIVDLIRQDQAFVATKCFYVGGLARQIDIVFCVDLELLSDLWLQFQKLRPGTAKL